MADLAFVRKLMREPMLEREEERDLAKAWQENRDEKALHLLIRSYARIVVSIAIRFRYYGIPLNDLIQEGNLGLMQAADRFDPDRDVRFSSYAKWWVRSFIQNFILRNWSIVRTGSTVGQKQLFFNLRRLRAQLERVDENALSDDHRQKIADSLNVTIKEVEMMENRLAAQDLSLSTPTNDSSEEDWIDLLPDERASPESLTLEQQNNLIRHRWLQKALKCLTKREQNIIFARRLSETPATLDTLSKTLNISKERVRQLEVRAIRKMRHHLLHGIQNAKDLLYD
ncbi:MAG: RNA polymerase factor sigma-32 [Alphaproteobacteria bacterium]